MSKIQKQLQVVCGIVACSMMLAGLGHAQGMGAGGPIEVVVAAVQFPVGNQWNKSLAPSGDIQYGFHVLRNSDLQPVAGISGADIKLIIASTELYQCDQPGGGQDGSPYEYTAKAATDSQGRSYFQESIGGLDEGGGAVRVEIDNGQYITVGSNILQLRTPDRAGASGPDGSVNLPDMTAFQTGWSNCEWWTDFNGNGVCSDVADFTLFQSQFLKGCN